MSHRARVSSSSSSGSDECNCIWYSFFIFKLNRQPTLLSRATYSSNHGERRRRDLGGEGWRQQERELQLNSVKEWKISFLRNNAHSPILAVNSTWTAINIAKLHTVQELESASTMEGRKNISEYRLDDGEVVSSVRAGKKRTWKKFPPSRLVVKDTNWKLNEKWRREMALFALKKEKLRTSNYNWSVGSTA